jgi:uroporphyrinogen-III decarboxylase
MMAQALDAGGDPTAVFAANNAIAMGVIDELERRGLRIPHDIALVSFDDLPNTSRLFPFLTVAVQPAYEIGANAAQLLLSRLDADVPLPARHVILPTRLIVRYSCGSKLAGGNGRSLSLPLAIEPEQPSVLVPKVSPDLIRLASLDQMRAQIPADRRPLSMTEHDRSDAGRLLRVLRHQEADRLPYLPLWVHSQPVIEYVLERKLDYPVVYDHERGLSLAPEDHVEFAQRLAIDAVVCDFTWRPNNLFAVASNGREQYVGGAVRTWHDLENLDPPPPLAQQLNHLERYLRAAQGTGVGVIASFSSFFDNALRAVGVAEAMYLFYDNRQLLERLMDILADHQHRVMRAVCDRFADELALVLVEDDIAHASGLLIHPDMFQEIFPQRMQRLLAPAKEHGMLTIFHSDGCVDKVVPAFAGMGFDGLHLGAYEYADVAALRQALRGKMALIGTIPVLLLTYGSQQEIEDEVRRHCVELAPGAGYVLGLSASITQGIPPQNLMALVQAVHRYGRYAS